MLLACLLFSSVLCTVNILFGPSKLHVLPTSMEGLGDLFDETEGLVEPVAGVQDLLNATSALFPGRIDGDVGESIPGENLDVADADYDSELDSESSDYDANEDLDGDAAIYKAMEDGLFNDRMSRQMKRHADKTARLEPVSCAAAANFVCGYIII